ncbi:MAG: hypothetical protein AB1730_24950 [Myxococcota bacterium]|jgi:hypothetical protein
MRTPLVIAVLLSSTALAGAEAANELPEVARVNSPRGTPLVVRGKLSAARGRALTALARAVQRDVTRRFLSGDDHSGLSPVQLCLFEEAKSYDAFVGRLLDGAPAPSPLGFYQPSLRVVVANVGSSLGNLRHELSHALVGDDFPGVPSWLTEGVGALYGTASLQKDGTFRFVANYRLRDLRAAKKAGTLPTLDQLVSSSPADVYGARAMTFYGLSRHLLLYLDRSGTLSAFFADFRAASPVARAGVLKRYVDEPKFLAWTDTLVIGR